MPRATSRPNAGLRRDMRAFIDTNQGLFPCTHHQLASAFISHWEGQYEETPVSNCISALSREKYIIRNGHRGNYTYSLPQDSTPCDVVVIDNLLDAMAAAEATLRRVKTVLAALDKL